MKRVALPLLSLFLGALLLGAVRKSTHTVATPSGARHDGISAGSIARAIGSVNLDPRHPRDDDRAEVMRRLKDGERTTYINEIIEERDSALCRWPDRGGVPLSVWIQPHANVKDFEHGYVQSVHDAFDEWDDVHLPVRFAFVDDSAEADVHVNFIDHFKEAISGRTRWARDDDYAITDANIILAIHHNQGDQLDTDAMRAMALHEIGHLLGLDHTKDTLSIMAPRVRIRQLAAQDRATARLLYALPAGPIR
ncbi:MAG TPA: matrixin family metalloprotease [Gemmatimonadaceae bacterium]